MFHEHSQKQSSNASSGERAFILLLGIFNFCFSRLNKSKNLATAECEAVRRAVVRELFVAESATNQPSGLMPSAGDTARARHYSADCQICLKGRLRTAD